MSLCKFTLGAVIGAAGVILYEAYKRGDLCDVFSCCGSKSDRAWDRAKEKGREFADKAGETVRYAADNLHEGADKAADAVRRGVETAKDKGEQALNDAAEAAERK